MPVEKGNIIKVDYIGSTDGKVFDTSLENVARENNIFNEKRPYEPLSFTVGAGQMIKGFDDAVLGMNKGEEKKVELKPEEAYGDYREDLIKEYPKEMFNKEGVELQPGFVLHIKTPQGLLIAKVKEIKDDKVVLDLNHELAGKTLTFKIFLREIKP